MLDPDNLERWISSWRRGLKEAEDLQMVSMVCLMLACPSISWTTSVDAISSE
jgi:hypothetical protein